MANLSELHLQAVLEREALGQYERIIYALNEVTVVCDTAQYPGLMRLLRDHPALKFEQLIDLCGVDYSEYRNELNLTRRFAVVVHLLSLQHNQRIRVRAYIDDNDFPRIRSVVDLYNCANWYEREAFDLYGIIFDEHPDLRRILTDYGFVGHPLRKDFPVSGHVEMIYDAKEERVVYQPVTIEPRNNVPRVVREEGYGDEN